MNYFKSSLAGFGMSLIGVSLCGAKVAMEIHDRNKTTRPISHYWYSGEKWTVAQACLVNNMWSIPMAMLGAAYHDNFGRDAAKKFNEYFKSDISPYILDGAAFGAFFAIPLSLMFCQEFNLSEPWIYSLTIIQDFLVVCTAGLGAYFGDEKLTDSESNYLHLSDSLDADLQDSICPL